MAETEATEQPMTVLYGPPPGAAADREEAAYFPTLSPPLGWLRQEYEQRQTEREFREAELKEATERQARADGLEQRLTVAGEQWSRYRRVPHDPARPTANIPSPDAMQTSADVAQVMEDWNAKRKLLRDHGFDDNIPRPDFSVWADVQSPEVPPPHLPVDQDALADAALAVKHRISDRAGIKAKIARILHRPSQTPVTASRSAAQIEYEDASGREIVRTYDRGWFG